VSPRDGGLLGPLEEIVLLALGHSGDDAYGMTVRRELLERTGHDVSIGAVYSTLDRMEAKGLVTSRLADPDPGRGGHPRRYFVLTETGLAAVREAMRLRQRLWEGLPGGPHPAGPTD
jgi:DNA-binding PadR family transcriptional regulator